MKRIDKTYRWRNPTVIDRRSDFLEFLQTKPSYQGALAYRRLELKRLGWTVQENKQLEQQEPREELDLFIPMPKPKHHLKLV